MGGGNSGSDRWHENGVGGVMKTAECLFSSTNICSVWCHAVFLPIFMLTFTAGWAMLLLEGWADAGSCEPLGKIALIIFVYIFPALSFFENSSRFHMSQPYAVVERKGMGRVTPTPFSWTKQSIHLNCHAPPLPFPPQPTDSQSSLHSPSSPSCSWSPVHGFLMTGTRTFEKGSV